MVGANWCNHNGKVWSFLKTSKMELSYDPAILLLGIYPKKPKTLIQNNIRTNMFIAALFTIAETWKQLKCPSIRQVDKKAVVHIHNGTLPGRKKKEILPLATTWMDLECIMPMR